MKAKTSNLIFLVFWALFLSVGLSACQKDKDVNEDGFKDEKRSVSAYPFDAPNWDLVDLHSSEIFNIYSHGKRYYLRKQGFDQNYYYIHDNREYDLTIALNETYVAFYKYFIYYEGKSYFLNL